MRILPRNQGALFVCATLTVLAVDLTTKALAVRDPSLFGDGLLYNPVMPSSLARFVVCSVTIAAVTAISWFATRRGAGPIPLVWIAASLLVGGTLGNWSSGLIWELGVPDFIARGERMWNLADFSIGMGMLLFLLSTIGYSIRAYVRGRRARV